LTLNDFVLKEYLIKFIKTLVTSLLGVKFSS